MMTSHIDYTRTTYLVMLEGKQVWASNFSHLAEAEASGRNRSQPGHTVVTREPEKDNHGLQANTNHPF